MGVIKKLKAPARKQAQRQKIMGKKGAHIQDQRSLKSGGHKAKETIRRVGEYKAAKAAKKAAANRKKKVVRK